MNIQELEKKRLDAIGRRDPLAILETYQALGLELEPELAEMIEKAQLETGSIRPRTNEELNYSALLKTEGRRFGMKRKYLDFFNENELRQVYNGLNNIWLPSEMLILFPEGAITIPYAVGIIKQRQNPAHEPLLIAEKPYEVVKGCNEIAFRNSSIRKMNAEYQKDNKNKTALILHPHDLERRLGILDEKTARSFIDSFQAPYEHFRDLHGTREHKQEILSKFDRMYEAASRKYGNS